MIGFTFRLAHLKSTSLEAGDVVKRGDSLGVMGNTGQSTGPHGHIDVVKGRHSWMYRLSNIHSGNPAPDFEQLHYFIDRELTGEKPFRITSHIYDYRYVINGKWKAHPGYDIVIDDSDPMFYWNRSADGTVIASGYDSGYGLYLQIHYGA